MADMFNVINEDDILKRNEHDTVARGRVHTEYFHL